MAKEADNLVLQLLREIRSTQQDHGKKLGHLDKHVEDLLYKISARVKRLEAKV